ncbi:MAG: ribonuclease III [Clostridia bacterium]|nr:ribonuclease III [Clostridia bacterium]
MEGSSLLPLQRALGYTFADEGLLLTALTHTSFSNENKSTSKSNERIEFLGDAVLGLTISHILFHRYPTASEGVLSLYRQYLVCEATLARVAQRLSLGSYLRLGRGEERQGGREKRSILADATEALFAAIFLDAGEEAGGILADIMTKLFHDELLACERLRSGDYKSRLQQLVEQDGNERLNYRVASVQGPVHDPIFHVEALLNTNVIGKGVGRSKQEAEQLAAREALLLFGAKNL